jgi:hypothetical protein
MAQKKNNFSIRRSLWFPFKRCGDYGAQSIYVLVNFNLTICSAVALSWIAPNIFAKKILGHRQFFAHEELVGKALQGCIAKGLRYPPLFLRRSLGCGVGGTLVRNKVVLVRERPRANIASKSFLLEMYRVDVLTARKLAQVRARTTRPRAPKMCSILDRVMNLDVCCKISRSLAYTAASVAHVRLGLLLRRPLHAPPCADRWRFLSNGVFRNRHAFARCFLASLTPLPVRGSIRMTIYHMLVEAALALEFPRAHVASEEFG